MHRGLTFVIAITLGVVAPAAAQTRGAVGGSLFLDVKRFSGDAANRTNDGEAIGGGVRLAAYITPRWSVEVDVDISRTTAVTTTQSISRSLVYTSTIAPTLPAGSALSPDLFLPPNLSIFPFAFETRSTSGLTSASALIGYRIPGAGRVHPGFVGGLTFMRVRRGVDSPTRFVLPADLPRLYADLLPISLLSRRTERIDYVPAATVGFEVALDLTSHLAVVPELRAHMFSAAGLGAFAIRPGVAVRWMF